MRFITTILLLLGLASPLHAADKADQKAVQQIGDSLMRVTGTRPDLIEPSPTSGIYTVAFGTDIFYVTADGKYLFSGDMRELPTMRNVSDETLQRIRKPLIEELAKVDSIDFPAKGESKHTITVFTDIDCGYCVKLHSGMDKMNELGISVRYVAFPRAGLGSSSYDKWVDVWCSDDRQKSMTLAKSGGKLPKGNCDAPVKEHMRLASKLGVNGTPAVFSEDGRQLGGYLPPKRMLQALEK